MNPKDAKDRLGDTLRAAERARENLYFARVDEQLLQKIREKEAEAKRHRESEEAKPQLGACPRCEEPLHSGMWRNLPIEFCGDCGGLWLDQGDLLDLADRDDLHLKERDD